MTHDELEDSVALQLRRAELLYGPKKEGRVSNPTFIRMHPDELSPRVKAEATPKEKSQHGDERRERNGRPTVPTRF